MEKICKRCNFRTPAGRAVCQVCGHAKFFQAEDFNKEAPKEDSVLAKVEAAVSVTALNDLFARMNERATSVIGSLRSGIDAALTPKPAVVNEASNEAAGQSFTSDETVFSSASIKRQTLTNRKIEAMQPSTVEVAAEQGLDDLLAWFKSYGVDQPLILEKTHPFESATAPVVQHLDQKAA